MPTYEYACKACGEHLEAVQKFSDDPLTECPNCGGTLRKVYGNVGIAFKGSGFYKSDGSSSNGGSSSGDTSSSSSTSTSSGSSSESKSSSDSGSSSGSSSKAAA